MTGKNDRAAAISACEDGLRPSFPGDPGMKKKAGSEFTPRCLAPQRQPRLYCLRFRRRPARRRDAGVPAPGDADQAERARTEQPDRDGNRHRHGCLFVRAERERDVRNDRTAPTSSSPMSSAEHVPTWRIFTIPSPLISPSAYAACQDHGVPVVQTLHNYRLVCLGGLLRRDGRPCEDCVGISTSGSASLMLATTAIPLRRTMDGRVEKARRTISDQEIRAAI